MAGTIAYGDLMSCLRGSTPIEIGHILESVKILPNPPASNEPDLWGYVTAQGISLAEIQAPDRQRTICLAVTSRDTRDQGRPSSWSGEIDQLASGSEDDTMRLIVISGGNYKDIQLARNYPDEQITDSVHDPGQSWNALTVGAFTSLNHLSEHSMKNFTPIAPKNGLSPFSTTSSIWEDKWPIKPEIVMEGGNLAYDGNGFVTECDDLSILSTYYKPTDSHFYPFSMTSAASAQAARFAAKIQIDYPELWPETVRALIVHSSEWTETLKSQFLNSDSKTDYKRLLRICGYGVPDINRALYSASNSLTLIAQQTIQPFDRKEDGSGYRTRDMHLYELPWPKEVLLDLPLETDVMMRVTLSYFIEPGPGEIGWQDRYRYASHALRFDVKSPGESKEKFIKRINIAARDEDEESPYTESASQHWTLGSHARDKGSIHSDIWKGTTAELADSNIISVYPRIGWWRERHHLGKWNKQTRYALVVSISTPEEEIDIYTPVAIQVGVAIPISVGVSR